MNYWLLKSEPDVWSIDQQKKAGTKGAPWDGVRNYQAANNLRSMKKGDILFVMGLIVTTVILHKIDADNAKTIPI